MARQPDRRCSLSIRHYGGSSPPIGPTSAQRNNYSLNDFVWINVIGAATLVYPMFIGVGIAALHDRSATLAFPRWFGYGSIFVFVANCPAQLLYFFKAGPFAWNGLFAIYAPFTVFFIWILTAGCLIRKALLSAATDSVDPAFSPKAAIFS
ncbi:MAG: hypothetical protein ABW034_17380 [Steroidobacteraceae bacterium]